MSTYITSAPAEAKWTIEDISVSINAARHDYAIIDEGGKEAYIGFDQIDKVIDALKSAKSIFTEYKKEAVNG